MLIALDYDETYTKDPVLWDQFIDDAQRRNHQVILVTYRDKNLDPIANTSPVYDKFTRHAIPTYYTGGVAKKWWMRNFGPKEGVDIWIDDTPESILNNSEMSSEALALWRNNLKQGK